MAHFILSTINIGYYGPSHYLRKIYIVNGFIYRPVNSNILLCMDMDKVSIKGIITSPYGGKEVVLWVLKGN
jgi:hypothetical protein